MTEPVAPQHDSHEVLRVLYPWYKEEVFRRRELMMRLTWFGATIHVFLLTILLIIPTRHPTAATTALFAITGVALFTATFVFLIFQQRNRHRMAKATLIEIERALGLYATGLIVEGKALYPEGWQTAWLKDQSVTVYVTVLSALTALVIGAILLRA